MQFLVNYLQGIRGALSQSARRKTSLKLICHEWAATSINWTGPGLNTNCLRYATNLIYLYKLQFAGVDRNQQHPHIDAPENNPAQPAAASTAVTTEPTDLAPGSAPATASPQPIPLEILSEVMAIAHAEVHASLEVSIDGNQQVAIAHSQILMRLKMRLSNIHTTAAFGLAQ